MQRIKSWLLVAGPIAAVLLLSWGLWFAVLMRPEEVKIWLARKYGQGTKKEAPR